MTVRRWTAIAATCLAVSSAGPASAAASARLVYVRGPGAETCPGELAVRAAVRARLGYDPFFAWARDTLYAEIEREGGVFRAIVKVIDAENRQQGAREIKVQGTDCTPVIDAIGLTGSLTLDPSSILGTGPRPAAPPAPESAREPAAPEPAAAIDAPRRPAADVAVRAEPPGVREPVIFHAGVGMIAAVESAPSPTAGATVSVGASWRHLSLDLEGRADLPAARPGPVPPTEVRSWLIVGALVPCFRVAFASVCPVLSAGAIGATATHVAHSSEQYGPWAAVGGRLGASWEIAPRLTIGAYIEALATLIRDNVSVDATVQYPVGPWSGGLGAGASWRFR